MIEACCLFQVGVLILGLGSTRTGDSTSEFTFVLLITTCRRHTKTDICYDLQGS